MSKCASLAAIMGQAISKTPPTPPIADSLTAELVRRALVAEPAFALCWVHLQLIGKRELGSEATTIGGEIAVRVADGIIMLDGRVACLCQKRLAGALAWWVPGCGGVLNRLGLMAPEDDSEAAITDAVRLVLKKDPFVNSNQIRVSADRATVILDGLVPTDLARTIAEHDAGYVYGVEKVVNRIALG